MQLFLFSPIIIIPMWHIWKKFNAKSAFIFSMGFQVIALATMLTLSIDRNWPATSGIP